MASLVGFGNNGLHLACLGLGKETTIFLHCKEKFPGLSGECVGEVFYKVASSRYVNNLVEVALFLEKQLLVAGYALCKFVWSFKGLVKRSYNDALYTGKSGRHGLGLGAKHVDIAVKQGEVVACGGGAYMHLGALLARSVLAYNLCPQHTCGTELRYFHEVHTVDAHIELDVVCCKFGSYACVGQLLHILVAPCQSVAQFLIAVGSAVGQSGGVDSYGAEIGIVGKCLYCLFQLWKNS